MAEKKPTTLFVVYVEILVGSRRLIQYVGKTKAKDGNGAKRNVMFREYGPGWEESCPNWEPQAVVFGSDEHQKLRRALASARQQTQTQQKTLFSPSPV